MSAIIAGFLDFVGLKIKKDDDIFDRLSSRYTVGLLMSCVAIITVYNLGGSPMKCWVPVHFTGNHMKYANSYCWVANTYYAPMNVEFPRPEDEEGRQKVTYYQWVPFILILQAVMFYIPSLVWHGLNQRGGIDSDHILDTAGSLTKTEMEENRADILMVICNQVHRFLGSKRHDDRGFRRKVKGALFSSRFSSYLVILFVVSKLLYIANAVSQFYLLDALLTPGFSTYGLRVLREEPEDNDSDMAVRPVFPKVAFCDMGLRRMGFNQQYALQCTLPFNVWHEGIFKVVWYWTCGVAALSVLGLVVWLFRFICRPDRVSFIANHLRAGNRLPSSRDSKDSKDGDGAGGRGGGRVYSGSEDRESLLLADFVDDYLGQDGVFLLRLIAHNTNNITTTDVICRLWDLWLDDDDARLLRQRLRDRRRHRDGDVIDDADDDMMKGSDEATLVLSPGGKVSV